MDSLTQTQDALDKLVTIMYSSISYLTTHSNFKQVNPDIPVTQVIPGAESDETFNTNREEMVVDFVRKAKQLEYLISVLPSESELSAVGSEGEITRLNKELKQANEELQEAAKRAGQLEAMDASLRDAILE